jgi:hypothetical protein
MEKEKEGKGKRRGKEKGEERKKERKGRGKGKKGRVSHGPFLMPNVIVFVIVRESCVRSFFPVNGRNHQKRSVATTNQAPPCAESDMHSLACHYGNKQ